MIFSNKPEGTVAHKSLPQSVYDWLKAAIFNGQLQPGQMLRQEELARQLGVSRVPVREALQKLEGEGQVILHPRRGYAVMELNVDEISEIFRARMLIEERASHFAARKREDADVNRATVVFEAMEKIATHESDNIAEWSRLNIEFHEALMEPAGLPYIQHMASSLRSAVEPYIRMEMVMTGEHRQAQEEHRLMLQAFKAGDAELLASLSRRHCAHTAQRLLMGLGERFAA